MKTKLTIALVFATISFCFAQVPLSAAQQITFKNKVQKTARETKSITSDFTQTKHLDILIDVSTSSGKLYYAAPDNIRWEYTEPQSSIAIFKEDVLWVSHEGKTEKIDLSSKKLFKRFNTLIVNSITGTMFDEEQFEISYFKIAKGYMVKFLPKEKRLQRFVATIQLTFTENTGEVTQVKLIEPNDDYTLITFNNRAINSSIPKEKFKL